MIPKEFQLMGTTIQVRFVRGEFFFDQSTYGHWDPEKAVITISKDVPLTVQEHTFCHELVHAVLDILGYTDLSKDEELVDRWGGMLHQFLLQYDMD